MHFYYILHKIALVTYWESHGIILAPPPKKKQRHSAVFGSPLSSQEMIDAI